MKETPISVEALTGVAIRTAEAVTDRRKSIIRLQAAELKESFRDLPLMPDRM
jgi:hypothetical protein